MNKIKIFEVERGSMNKIKIFEVVKVDLFSHACSGPYL